MASRSVQFPAVQVPSSVSAVESTENVSGSPAVTVRHAENSEALLPATLVAVAVTTPPVLTDVLRSS